MKYLQSQVISRRHPNINKLYVAILALSLTQYLLLSQIMRLIVRPLLVLAVAVAVVVAVRITMKDCLPLIVVL
jgi:hypothetical protein